MKKKSIFYCVFFLGVCLYDIHAQASISAGNTKYDNKEIWQSCDKNGIVVKQMAEIIHDYGNYFRLTVFIDNHSNEEIYIDPSIIEATSINKKGDVEYLHTLSTKEYIDKVYTINSVIITLNAASRGLSMSNGNQTATITSKTDYDNGYSKTTKTTINYYDPIAAELERDKNDQAIEAMKNNNYNECMNRMKQMLPETILYSGQSIIGYVYIKRKPRNKQMNNDVIINGVRYHFSWNWD